MPPLQEVDLSNRFDDIRSAWRIDSYRDFEIGGTAYKRYIALFTPNDFTEFVAGRVNEASPNTINLMVKTRDAQGNRNPYFEGDRRAHLLVDRIFEELESEAIGINSLRVSWAKPSQKMPYSDNFMQYCTAKETALAEGASKEEARHYAVMNTWTGAMVGKRHNLTVPSAIHEERRLGRLVGVSGLLLRP